MNGRRTSQTIHTIPLANRWNPAGRIGSGPLYRAIADVIASDIANGQLRAGDRLPTHRALAGALGIDLTTVTRAYGEARARGLVDTAVGRGTFVRERVVIPPAVPAVELDLSMNIPPRPLGIDLQAALSRTMAAVTRRADLLRLLSYQPAGGALADRAAGAAWLAPVLPGLPAERVLITGGAQAALAALLTALVRPGRVVLSGHYTYPGFRAAAAALGLAVRGVAMDADGLCPDALAAASAAGDVDALYLTPTLHNPTTATLPLERRQAIVDIARHRGFCIIEDDAYGRLPENPLPPLAALGPDVVWHVATLAKVLTPGLRLAYVVAPDVARAAQARTALRAIAQMPPPLSVATASAWIADGTAEAILQGVRVEATARQQLAAGLLPPALISAKVEGHHLWLTLPPGWTETDFVAAARRAGAALVPGSAFAVGQAGGCHVRVALGAAPDHTGLSLALENIAEILADGPPHPQEFV
jgi:DNA-binding transcriptional MocR family regulator